VKRLIISSERLTDDGVGSPGPRAPGAAEPPREPPEAAAGPPAGPGRGGADPWPGASWQAWLASAPGRYVLEWEQAGFDAAVGDVFGFHAVQLGLPVLDCLRANRMPHRIGVVSPSDPAPVAGVPGGPWPVEGGVAGSAGVAEAARAAGAEARAGAWGIAGTPGSDRRDSLGATVPEATTHDAAAHDAAALGATEHGAHDAQAAAARSVVRVAHFEELPFDSQSIDLIVLPHVLEFAQDPHQVLREVERVLRPEGRLTLSGFNPVSLWGARQILLRGVARPFLPRQGHFIGAPRMRDWLKLLSFEIDGARYGCYRPPCRTPLWLERTRFLESAGDRWWPICGAVYTLSAVKRVRGMRLIGPAWKRQAARGAVAVAAPQRSGLNCGTGAPAAPDALTEAGTCSRASAAADSRRSRCVPPAAGRC